MNLITKIEAYEDLTNDKSSDKYEYIFPSFEFSKRIESNYNGDYEIVSKGNYKNYDTNIFEKVLINDLKFSLNPEISPSGFVNKFSLLLKNVTSEGENSSNYKNKFSSENYGSFFYDISYPLKNEGKFFDNFFTAKGSLMYSPNANKDLKTLDRKIVSGAIKFTPFTKALFLKTSWESRYALALFNLLFLFIKNFFTLIM